MSDCVFCRIVQKEVPAEVLFENDEVIVILDINPIHYGHALVIPKKHCRDFLELPPCSYQAILEAARVVCQALVRGLGLEGYNLFSNNGRSAGQSVFHFHLHVTPRYPNDDIRFVLELKKYSDGQLKHYAELIKKQFDSI